jgi:hypothetical protein
VGELVEGTETWFAPVDVVATRCTALLAEATQISLEVHPPGSAYEPRQPPHAQPGIVYIFRAEGTTRIKIGRTDRLALR